MALEIIKLEKKYTLLYGMSMTLQLRYIKI